MKNFEWIQPIKLDSSKVNIFFTSDLHFNHKNIIKFCNRPFKDVDEMNSKLIENWNSVVGKDDIVFDLGDFCFGSSEKWKELISQLNGHHHLILGNHDCLKQANFKILSMFESVNFQLYLKIDDRYIYLNHYPFLCYGGTYLKNGEEVIQLYGHVHSGPYSTGKDSDRLIYTFPFQYDVGVDNNNYTPISWKEVLYFIELRKNIEIEKLQLESDRESLLDRTINDPML